MQERLWQGQCTWQKDNSTFGGQILRDRKCSRCPTKSTVVNIVQIVQIQQVRLIFNPLTDIFTKWFLVLLYFVQFAYARSEFCKERAEGRHGRSSKMMFTKCQLFFWKTFLGKSSWHSRKFWIFLGIMPNDERSWPLWASATLPVFWNLATKRWIVLPLGTLFLPKFFFLHCRFVRRTDFAAKYSSMIFIRCWVV